MISHYLLTKVRNSRLIVLFSPPHARLFVFLVFVLHCRPGHPEGTLLVVVVFVPGAIEGGAEDLLRMLRQVRADTFRQVACLGIGHGGGLAALVGVAVLALVAMVLAALAP